MNIRESYRLKFSVYFSNHDYFWDMLDPENEWVWVYIAEYFTA